MRARHALALAALLLVAGCIRPSGDVQAPAAAEDALAGDPFAGFADPLLVGHDHAELAAHALTTPTMEALAHLPLAEPGVAFGELDLLGEDHLVVSALLQGFFIVDVSDPASPRAVSFTPDPGFVADVKASESGNYVFLGVQLGTFTGIHAYNVAVRERPVFAGAFPMQGGCHMLAVHREHLYCAPNDASVRIFEIVETPAAVALVPKAAYAPMGAPAAPILMTGRQTAEMTHDMTVQDDPVTGTAVMFVSFWDYGLRVVDVEDPARPTEIGAWTGEGTEDIYEGNVHTAMAGMVDGRRVVVLVPEYALVPAVTFLDATDYANMRVLGAWVPKDGEAYEGEHSTFSMHNFQLVDGKVYLAMYHGGVWVLDAATRAPLGYHLPAVAPSAPADLPTLAFLGGASPNVWDVVVKDGVILASDIASGVHALRLVGDSADTTSFA